MSPYLITLNQPTFLTLFIWAHHYHQHSNPLFVFVDYVRRFATEEALRETEKKDDSSDSELSDFSDDETKDMEL